MLLETLFEYGSRSSEVWDEYIAQGRMTVPKTVDLACDTLCQKYDCCGDNSMIYYRGMIHL